MKTPKALCASLIILLSSFHASQAWVTGGYVICDSNTNGLVDTGDIPLPGVLVVVTNTSGTYSNAAWTASPDGGFALELPTTPDTYVEYLHPLTLASDATITAPVGGVYTFSLDGVTQSNFLGSFLVNSATCPSQSTPQTNNCCVTGGGTVCKTKGKPAYTFSLHALPQKDGTAKGKLDIVAHDARLHLVSDVFEIVSCGSVEGTTCQFIEFQGAGTLKGIAGRKANYGVVYFYARAEDCGEGKNKGDRLYVRVYAADGSVLLLISADASNPGNVAPVFTSTGNIQMHDCHGSGDTGHGEGDHGKCDKCSSCIKAGKCDQCEKCKTGHGECSADKQKKK